jgi:hypothetical protein
LPQEAIGSDLSRIGAIGSGVLGERARSYMSIQALSKRNDLLANEKLLVARAMKAIRAVM